LWCDQYRTDAIPIASTDAIPIASTDHNYINPNMGVGWGDYLIPF
jgi:hypothetical protein